VLSSNERNRQEIKMCENSWITVTQIDGFKLLLQSSDIRMVQESTFKIDEDWYEGTILVLHDKTQIECIEPFDEVFFLLTEEEVEDETEEEVEEIEE
jgi:hypothetical protein